jgi:FtsH-binding integral membrane protein
MKNSKFTALKAFWCCLNKMANRTTLFVILNFIVGLLVVWRGFYFTSSALDNGVPPLPIAAVLLFIGLVVLLCAAGAYLKKETGKLGTIAILAMVLLLVEGAVVVMVFGQFDWVEYIVISIPMILINAYLRKD